MPVQQFNEARFKQQVSAALTSIRTVLDNTRNPAVASEVPHSYTDKYLLAEFLANSSLAAQLNCLECLGVTPEILKKLKEWSTPRSVSLRFTATEKCDFVRTEERKVESDKEYVTEVKGVFGTAKRSDKTVTTVIEHFWNFQVSYELVAFQGNNPKDSIPLCSRSGKYEIKTNSKVNPKQSVAYRDNIDFNITWLLQNLNSDMQLCFTIDRKQKTCHTPRRNQEVNQALYYFSSFSDWARRIENYFRNTLFPVQTNHGLDISVISSNKIFVPVVPLFEENVDSADSGVDSKCLATLIPATKEGDEPAVLLPVTDVNQLLDEQKRSLEAKLAQIRSTLPESEGLITSPDAVIIVGLSHASEICQHYSDGVQYIENMLWNQLVSAIGKEVSPADFTEYMLYHNRKLFKPEFEPRKFCYAIRRPDHYPEGLLSIEGKIDGSGNEPVCTIVNRLETVTPMKFSINAATTITFGGERYVHAWMSHTFSGSSGIQLRLSARARQFSCFIMMIGNIVSADEFQPRHAIIIQNKDDLLIPLLLEQIPTAQAFNDTIDSLSEEQQRFAKAFRSMQLASTLFGICIIQIKPQLEKLLNLPDDSLTKEIQLTQELLDLFITYQIPSDLISFAGRENCSTTERVETVRQHVKAMQAMISKTKANELEQAQQEALYGRLDGSFKPEQTGIQQNLYRAMSGGRSQTSNSSTGVKKNEGDEPTEETPSGLDFTKLPVLLDRNFEAFDTDASLHSTILKTSGSWEKKFQKSLLATPSSSFLGLDEQRTERNRAFDLLDALSRSGILDIDEASFHVVIATTHTFDKTLMDTVIQDNINPIEKVERSMLIVASTIQEEDPEALIKPEHLERVKKASPVLF
uniref:Uncharacterized protein n=1 Tax=Vannella robusta TaxID=1487602 RepID=A0A7S4HH76_9EUKA|mmetsp:Transcript_10481/g.12955  ORF Transcript_10481/g.12955 Transcript_10481/m.12955 type:complete len:862 (+) Transcript_10481:13-2598(+)